MTAQKIQRQREAIMAMLPATSGQLAKKLGIPTRTVRYRMEVLEREKAVQVVGELDLAGKGAPAKIWGPHTGVPYARPAPPPLPEFKYKSIWVGGCPYHQKAENREAECQA